MKIFVATDLHGSAYWAEKVVNKFRQSGCDILVLLGDIYNHGPRNPFPQNYAPLEVAEILNGVSDKLVVVKGNCDSEVDEMISAFDFLPQEVLFVGEKRRVFFTHGHIYNKSKLPHLNKGDALIYGHFHQNEIIEADGVVCVNVNSCALPKGDGISSYCIVDEKAVAIFDFDDNTVLSKQF